jgi:uncharacterized repeat protein (TIGR01451 family)
VIHYSISVQNTGNVTIDQVTVSDNNADVSPAYASGDVNSNGVMEVGETWTYTAYHTVDQSDLNTGSVINRAEVTGQDPDGHSVTDTSNEVVVYMDRVSAIELTKTGEYVDANRDGIYNAGDQITYTFTIRNTGNEVLTNISVTDDNPLVVVTGTAIASLNPDESNNSSFSGVYTLTQADIDAGTFTNTATVTSTNPAGDPVTDTASDTQALSPSPSVELTKDGTYADYNNDGLYNAGDRITYRFTVTNTGNVVLGNITIADEVDDVTVSGGPLSGLAPGETDNNTFTGVYTLTQDDIDAGTFTNTAIVTAYPPEGDAVTGTDTDTQTFTALPGVSLEKTGTYVDNDPVGVYNAGDIITYQFIIENTGNVVLERITLDDDDPDVRISGTPIYDLAPGAVNRTSFTGTYTLTQEDISSGSFTNWATVIATTPSGSTVDNRDDDVQNFTAVPDIELEKAGLYVDTDPVGVYNPGDRITYTFTVRNTGNVPLTNIIITDNDNRVTVSGSPISSLAPGAVNSTSVTGIYTLTQDDINAGSFSNTATVTATTPSGGSVDDEDDDVQSFSASPDITIIKTGTYVDNAPSGYNAGDEITYTFTVQNTGNVILTDVTVTDNTANVVLTGSPVGSLAPGESNNTAYTARYVLTQDDINAGSFTNTATVTGTTPSGGSVTDNDDDVQQFTATGSVTLSKTGTYVDNPPAGYSAGDEIN